MNRRSFLKDSCKGMGSAVIAAQAFSFDGFASEHLPELPSDSNDEIFWQLVSDHYGVNRDIKNLYNGMSPVLKSVAYQQNRLNQKMVEDWGGISEVISESDKSHKIICHLLGCEEGETTFCRSTTDGFHLVLSGLKFSADDDILYTNLEYPSFVDKLKAKEKSCGVGLKEVKLSIPVPDKNQILDQIKRSISSKSKLLVISHIEWMTGEVLPIKEICDLCHSFGVEVYVDGAHSFAQIDFKIHDLNCDYFSAPFHKWLSGPMGGGIVFVKKEHLSKIDSFYEKPKSYEDSCAKFLSDHDYYWFAAAAALPALKLHKKITPKRRENRLRFLRDTLASEVGKNSNVNILTNLDQSKSCSFLSLEVKNKDLSDAKKQMRDDKIRYSGMIFDGLKFLRLGIGLYHSPKEIKSFASSLNQIFS